MKTTIFIRILSATLLPTVLILALMLSIINNVVRETGNENARQLVENFTRYTSEIIRSTFDDLAIELKNVSRYFPDIVLKEDNPSQRINDLLIEILETDETLNSVWVVLKEGVCGDGKLIKSAERRGDTISSEPVFNENLLLDKNLSLWYDIPMNEGNMYFDPLDMFDDGETEIIYNRPFYNCDLSYPIIYKGEIIGCMGFDLLYKQLFSAMDNLKIDNKRIIVLLSEENIIMYSSSKTHQGENFLDILDRYNPENTMQKFKESIFNREMYSANLYSAFLLEPAMFCNIPISIKDSDKSIFLYIVMPDSALYKSSNEAIAFVFSISIAGVLLLALCILFATKNIVAPIKKLTETSNMIAEGKLDIVFNHVDFKGKPVKNEIFQLEISLEKMLVQLNQNNDLKIQKMEADIEKERVKATSDVKNIFFANMSHEIRTPMNSILGITQILLHEDDLSEKQRKYINDIKISSDSLLNIINDILDLSKLESGKMTLLLVDYNFKQLMDNICSLAGFLAKQKNLDFEYSVIGEMPECLYGDDNRLRQVIINVLSNAIKFTNDGYVSMTVIVEEKNIIFKITDSGVGIKPENIPHLFHVFEQIPEQKTRKNVGTGLGLSICKNLIDIMNGEINVESVYGEGSTFTISVPRNDGNIAMLNGVNTEVEMSFSRDTKILIVDDNEINLHVAFGLLETLFGIECDLAQSGKEAVSCVMSTDYDIVFMDHMMPEMDGIETTEAIRNMGGKFKDLIIVALTANAILGTKQLLIDAGMNDFLSKPIDKNELQNILLKWLPEEKQSLKSIDNVKPNNNIEYSPVVKQAQSIVGLDVLAGLNNVSYNQKVYEKSLNILSLKIPELSKLITRLLGEGDFKNLSIHIHSIKSSLASLGAVSLSKQALKLEKASKDENAAFCNEISPIFISRLEKLGKHLEKIFNDAKSEIIKEPATKDEFYLYIENLNAFIKEYNYENALFIVDKLKVCDFGEKLNAYVVEINQLFEAFNYKAQGELLERLLNDENL